MSSIETATNIYPTGIGPWTPTSTWTDIVVLDDDDSLLPALLQIDQLRSLDEDWNSYGSPPPSADLIDAVEHFVKASSKAFHPFLPSPDVFAVPGGGVQLEWRRGDRELELEFGAVRDGDMEVEYLQVVLEEPVSEDVVRSIPELVDLLVWLTEG